MRHRILVGMAAIWAAFSIGSASAAEVQVRGKTAPPPKVVMATVGDHEITVYQFMQYMAQDGRRVAEGATPQGKARLVREMIIAELLKQAMYLEGLLPTDPEVKLTQKDVVRAQQALAGKHFPAPPAPSEEDAYAYYQAHAEKFGLPATVRVSQIQLLVPQDADEAAAAQVRARAEAALKRIEAGEDFAAVASEVTENPRAKVAGGDIGFVPRSVDPWLSQALTGLEVGDHTGVIQSPVGYEILKLTDSRETTIAPFANVRDHVIQAMRLEGQIRARDIYARELAEEIGVKIEMDDLKGAMP